MKAFYDEHFALLMRGQDSAYHARVRDFVLRVLELAPGARIIDLGCGIGRISQALAYAGLEVIGVDRQPEYIHEASQIGPASRLRFVCADAREFVAVPAADAVLSWHTSFGQHASDADNLQILRSAWRSLRPGGSLLLDFANFYRTLMVFQPVFVQHFATPAGDVEVQRHSEILPEAGLLRQSWEFIYADGRRARREGSLKIYLPDRLAALLEAAGFEVLRAFGDLDATPFALGHSRWIAHARRPEAQV